MNSADTTQWADADTLQPSQFLIDQGRLDALERCITQQRVSPIPVRRINGRLVMLDGHHRACALLRRGMDRLPIVIDNDGDVSLPLYRACVAACRARGVLSALDLTGRVVSPQDFQRDWDGYCDYIQAHEGYAKDPCGYAALPLWKQRQLVPPISLRVMHARAWDALGVAERGRFDDVRRFFRLRHDLTGVPDAALPPGCAFVPADGRDAADRARIAAFLRLCYPDTDADEAAVLGWTQTPVYAPALWVWITDEAGQPVALGIADADLDWGEGILEWVQVHPAARGRGLGMALVSELLRRMQQLHLSYATVSGDADSPNKPESLYRRCGFVGEDVWVVACEKETLE